MLRLSASSIVLILFSFVGMMIVTVTPRAAEACSCISPPLNRTTAQFDGVENFPTDGVLRVFFTGGFIGYSAALRRALADEYRLVDESGEVIALEFLDVVRTRLDMRPVSTLKPDTEYTVERLFAYDDEGQRVGDQGRWDNNDLSRPPQRGGDDDPLFYAWFVETSFRTADEAVERPEIKPQLAQSRMDFAIDGGTCGPGISVSVDFELPEGVQFTDVIELEIQGHGVGDTRPAFDRGPLSADEISTNRASPNPLSKLVVSDMLCNSDKVTIDYSPSLQVRVSIRDASGGIVGSSDWASPEERSRVGSVEDLKDRPRASENQPEFDEELWQEPSIVDLDQARTPGPASCPYGLEVLDRRQLSSMESYAASEVNWRGNQGWLMLLDEDRNTLVYRLAHDDESGTITEERLTDLRGRFQSTYATEDGVLIVTALYAEDSEEEEEDTKYTVHSLDSEGDLRWKRELDVEMGQRFGITVGSDRVLVTWLERVTSAADFRPTRALLQVETGDMIHRNIERQSASMDADVAAAFVGGRFILAYFERMGEPIELLGVSTEGDVEFRKSTAIRATEFIDMASTGTDVALVTSSDGNFQWTLFDKNGDHFERFALINPGSHLRQPRATSITWRADKKVPIFLGPLQRFRGQVQIEGDFAVTWEHGWPNRIHASVVDTDGRVSPSTELASDIPAESTTIAAVGENRFIATFTNGNRSNYLAHLACRTTPTPGAPQRIVIPEESDGL